jgi:hypothetical protein
VINLVGDWWFVQMDHFRWLHVDRLEHMALV